MRPQELAERITRIRLPQHIIATGAALDEMTVSRVLNGRTDARNSTLDRIEQQVCAEEIALRDHLLALHPIEQSEAA